MFSLILAALYVAFKVLFTETDAITAVESTFGFLWYWHLGFAVAKLVVGIVVALAAMLGAASGSSTTGERTAVVGFIGLLSPLLIFAFMLTSFLFLFGVYAMDSGIQGGVVVNQSRLIIGCVLYGLACLTQIRASRSSSSSSSD